MRPDVRKHPVGSLLSHAAMGDLPTEKELNRLELPAQARRDLADAALVTVGIKTGGANGQARAFASEKAEQIISELPANYQDHTYLEDPDQEPDDPKSLADRVQRRW